MGAFPTLESKTFDEAFPCLVRKHLVHIIETVHHVGQEKKFYMMLAVFYPRWVITDKSALDITLFL